MAVLKREKLYELVWQEPMGELARDLGYTSAQLREACKAMSIPQPAMGYWRFPADKRIPPTPLPSHTGPDEVRIGGKEKESLVEWMLRLRAEEPIEPAKTKPPPRRIQASPPTPIPKTTSSTLSRMMPLDAWAEMWFGEYKPHRNTLLRWIHEGRIQPQPVRIGRGYMVKREAEYRPD